MVAKAWFFGGGWAPGSYRHRHRHRHVRDHSGTKSVHLGPSFRKHAPAARVRSLTAPHVAPSDCACAESRQRQGGRRRGPGLPSAPWPRLLSHLLQSPRSALRRARCCARTRATRPRTGACPALAERPSPCYHCGALTQLPEHRKTNCCLVLTPLVFSVVLGGARPVANAWPARCLAACLQPLELPRLTAQW